MLSPSSRSTSLANSRAPFILRSASADVHRGENVFSTYSIGGAARSIEYDGKGRVWTAEVDGRILIRTVPRGEVFFEAPVRGSSFCTVLRRVSNKHIWAAFADGFIRCYSTSSGEMEREFVQHDGAVHCLACSPASSYVYSGGEDWKVYQWSRSTCTYVRLFSGHANAVRCVLVVTGATYMNEEMQQSNEGEDKNCSDVIDDEQHEFKDEFVISGSDDMTIKVWNPRAPLQIDKDEACVATLSGHHGSIRAIEVHPRRDELWSGGDDCIVRVWNWRRKEGRRCIAVLEGQHTAPVTAISYVPPRMWSSGRDGFVVVWDTWERRPLHCIQLAARPKSRSITTMQPLYRAAHWIVWLSGPEGAIHALQVADEENDVMSKLRVYEHRRKVDTQKHSRYQAKTLKMEQHIHELEQRNKLLEQQLHQCHGNHQETCMRLLEEDIDCGTASNSNRKFTDKRDIAEIDELKAVVGRLESQLEVYKKTIVTNTKDTMQKDDIIQSLKRQLSEKDTIIHSMEGMIATLHEHKGSVDTVDMKGVYREGQFVEEGRCTLSQQHGALDAYTQEVEQQWNKDKEERDSLRRQLLEAQNYKELWEAKDEALCDARDQILGLQRQLEEERQCVNELLKELDKHSQLPTQLQQNQQQQVGNTLLHTNTADRATTHFFKRLQGTNWQNISQRAPEQLYETITEDLNEILHNTDANIMDVAYATGVNCILVDVTIDHTSTEPQHIQKVFDESNFHRTAKLSELQLFHKTEIITQKDLTKKEYDSVLEAKKAAERERDEVRQRLQAATMELESLLNQQQQAEARRARMAELPMKTRRAESDSVRGRASPPQRGEPPVYVVTAEEYDSVLEAKKAAERERDEVRQRLQAATMELESLLNQQQQAEARRARMAELPMKTRRAESDSVRGRASPPQRGEPPVYVVTAEEYDSVLEAKKAAERERDEVRQRLQAATMELESFLNQQQQAEARRARMAELPMKTRRAESDSVRGRASPPQRGEPPVYVVTAEEYDSVLEAKKAAERERDEVRQRLQAATMELESFLNQQQQAEARRARMAELPMKTRRAESDSVRGRASPPQRGEPPVYVVTAEEYDSVLEAKKAAERERDEVRQRLQAATMELESFLNQQQQAEARRARMAELPMKTRRAESDSVRGRASPPQRGEPPVYVVTAEEYDSVLEAKKAAERERDEVRQRLQAATMELESLLNQQQQTEARRARMAELPMKTRRAESDSVRGRASPPQRGEPPVYVVTAEEYDSVLEAKKAAERERDEVRQRLQAATMELESLLNQQQQAEARRARMAELPMKTRRAESDSVRGRASPPQRGEPPVYVVTAEEYDSVLEAKKAAERERDEVRQRLQAATMELESFLNQQQQAEARRARMAELPMKTRRAESDSVRGRASPPQRGEPPVYVVTAEEYDSVLEAKKAAERERDEVRQRLQAATMELESLLNQQQQTEARRARMAELPMKTRRAESDSVRGRASPPQRGEPPVYVVTAEEYDSVLEAKKAAERERDEVRQRLQAATMELESLLNQQQQAEARRARMAELPMKTRRAESDSVRGRASPPQRGEPPVYVVTAEEYDSVLEAKKAAERERDEVRQRLQAATMELESLLNQQQQAEARRARMAELPMKTRRAESDSVRGRASPPQRGEPPVYVVTAEEYDSVLEAKKAAERERDEVRQRLQAATMELESFLNQQQQAEARRARMAELPMKTRRAESDSVRGRASPPQRGEPPVYVVTAEEYDSVLEAKKAAERERDEVRQRLQAATMELESFLNQQQQAEARRARMAELPMKTRRAESDSVRGRASPPQRGEPPVYVVTAEEYDSVLEAKKAAERERDEVRQRLQAATMELESFLNQQQQAEARRARMAELPMKTRRAESDSVRGRASPPQRGEPPVYVVTAEEYDSVLEAKKAAERERDEVRQRLQAATMELESLLDQQQQVNVSGISGSGGMMSEKSNPSTGGDWQVAGESGVINDPNTWEGKMTVRNVTRDVSFQGISSAMYVGRSHSGVPSWNRHRCGLGESWIPLVGQYRVLVEDVLLLEVCRAVSVQLDHVRRIEFLDGGLAVDIEIFYSESSSHVDYCLRRHICTTMIELLRLSRGMNNNTVNSLRGHPSFDMRTASPQGDQVPQTNVTLQSELHPGVMQAWGQPQVANSNLLMNELDLFRSRRALASSMRGLEETLQSSFNLPGNIDPKAAVDLFLLRREPVYCVTIDEYRALLQQFPSAHCSETDDDDEDDGDGTRLWNEHIVARAEEERRFTHRLSQFTSQYPHCSGSENRPDHSWK